tara:strand:+ start:7606 stop:8772 length:1167 start_codon:yes stop_codon:yes gene_type:complete
MTDNNPNGDHEVTDLMEQPKADDSISDTITQAIKMAYPLEQHQLLVDATQWPLSYLVPDLISDEELSEIVTALDPLTVGQFFCSLGLSETDGGRDLAIWSEDIEDDASPHQTIGVLIFDEITNEIEETNTLMESVSAILLEDKDSIINNYVVPHYKVPLRDFDAEDPFETALLRGLRSHFDRSVGDSVFCYLRYDLALFDDSDFVSCFEYVLDGPPPLVLPSVEDLLSREEFSITLSNGITVVKTVKGGNRQIIFENPFPLEEMPKDFGDDCLRIVFQLRSQMRRAGENLLKEEIRILLNNFGADPNFVENLISDEGDLLLEAFLNLGWDLEPWDWLCDSFLGVNLGFAHFNSQSCIWISSMETDEVIDYWTQIIKDCESLASTGGDF